MPLDPSIIAGFRPPQVNLDVPSPIQQFGQVMTLRGLMDQQQIRQMQMQGERLDLEQKQRTASEQQALANYLKSAYGGAQPAPTQAPATPAAPASIGQMMTGTPSAPAPSAPQVGGLHIGEILRVAPTLGPAFIKTQLGLQQAEHEANIKKYDALAKQAEGLGRLGISIRDAKDPEARFAPAIWEGINNGLITPEVGRQMIADGYAKHAGDVDAYINGAQSVKDHAVTVKDDLEALGKAKDFTASAIGAVSDQAGYDRLFPQLDKRIQAVLGPTYSPQLKDAVRDNWGVSVADLPKTLEARRGIAVPALVAAFKQGPEAYKALLAKSPKDIQDTFGDAKSTDDINRQALTPAQRQQADKEATEIADIDVGGKPHKMLINKQTGAVVKDLGPSGFRPQQVNVNAATNLLDRESARFAKPHEKAVADANSQLEKINDARAMINGPAEAQALGIPKVLSALVGGQSSGLKINMAELNMLAKARGITGDVEGFLRKVSGGGTLTREQQQQLTQILDDVAARIRQKQTMANDALDRINSAGSREEIVGIDKDVRNKLSAMESGPASAGPLKINTKEEYDKLPPGAQYVDAQDGKTYTKR